MPDLTTADRLASERDQAVTELQQLRADIQANAAYWTDEAKTLRVTRDKSTQHHRRDRLEAVALALDAVAKSMRALLADTPETTPNTTPPATRATTDTPNSKINE